MGRYAEMTKVFGIGWHKTGTKTLAQCMRILGYDHLSYDPEVSGSLLKQVMQGDCTGLFEAADRHASFDDFPWPLAFRELDARYPDAKFSLTMRKSSKSWINSLLKHATRTGPMWTRKLVYGHRMPHGHEEAHIARYEQHNRDVLEHFKGREDKLYPLCWETLQGWVELCAFLGKEVPDAPIPHENRSPWSLDRWKHKVVQSLLGLGS